MKNKSNHYSRRDFIQNSIKGTLGLCGLSFFNTNSFGNSFAGIKSSYQNFSNTNPSSINKVNEISNVVLVKDESAGVDPNSSKRFPVNQSIVQKMMDSGIRAFTGIEDIGDAWKSLFPGITIDKVISIKLNCIGSSTANGLVNNPEVTYSVVNGLKSMNFDGQFFPVENIILWDRSDLELKNAGYTINKSSVGMKCYGTNNKPLYTGSLEGYSTETYDVSGVSQHISKIITEQSDYIINLSVAKQHMDSGVSINLKNHFGSCSNPEKLHANNCDPGIAALYNLDVIKTKEVINICDAIYAIISGGPISAPQIKANTILISKDPVAIDTIGVKLLIDNGMSAGNKSRATYLIKAAGSPYNLGNNSLDKINVIEIYNPTSIENNSIEPSHPVGFRLYQNYPNPFNPSTTISYQLFKPFNVKLNIYDVQGRLVKELVNQSQYKGYYSINWDGKSSGGVSAASGVYLAKLQLNNLVQSIQMQLIK